MGPAHHLSVGAGGLGVFMELLLSASEFSLERNIPVSSTVVVSRTLSKEKSLDQKSPKANSISVYSCLRQNGREAKDKILGRQAWTADTVL